MRYRYLVDFRRGISVFANFSCSIAILDTPLPLQCLPLNALPLRSIFAFATTWVRNKFVTLCIRLSEKSSVLFTAALRPNISYPEIHEVDLAGYLCIIVKRTLVKQFASVYFWHWISNKLCKYCEKIAFVSSEMMGAVDCDFAKMI